MLLPTGVDKADYHAALSGHRFTRTTVEILTAEHEPVSAITPEALSAQVNYTGSKSEVSRTLQMQLLDPDHALNFDSDSPGDGVIYAHLFVRVTQEIRSPLWLPDWTPVHAFTGPLVPGTFHRDGDTVDLEAQGKEQRAKTDVPSLVCKKNMYVVDAIHKIMQKACGEHLFAFPRAEGNGKLPKDVDVGRKEQNEPWKVVLKLARSIGMQLFYNGSGVLVLRDPPTKPMFEFTPIGPVDVADSEGGFNRVRVDGKKKAHASAEAEKHPFSPQKMGRNGVDYEHTLKIEDDTIGTNKQARRVANRELADVLEQDMQVSGTVIPVWHLDPGDMDELDGNPFRLGEASAPFGEGEMTVGYVDEVRKPIR